MIYAAAVISTAISWYIGSILDPAGNGSIAIVFSIITMGMFILYSINRKKNN